MSSESFAWLHLTDFHFGLKGQKFLWPNLRQPFLDDLAQVHERTGPWQAVLFTGDFVQQGKSEEFREMQKEVLDRLWAKLDELGSGAAVLLAVPGNHDLYRPDSTGDNPAVDVLLEKDGFNRVASKFWDNPAGAYRRVINDSLAAYSEWWKDAPQRPTAHITTGIIPGDFACTLECGGRRIGIVGLNTTFLQLQGGDYQGKLVWDARQLHAVCGAAVDDWLNQHHVCVLLTHQGPDWLTPQARKHGENEIAPAGRFASHLFGHMHETCLNYIRKIGAGNAVRLCQGCSVFGMEMFGEPPKLVRSHGYSAGRIEFTKSSAILRLWPRIATNKTGPWRFIPDHENAELKDDEGTPPDTITVRPVTTAIAVSTKAKKHAPAKLRPSGTTSATALLIPHSTLPSRRPFFGRDKELGIIAKVLQPEHVGWGVVLDGPGGIGKTALAVEAAHLAPAEHYPLKLFITAKGRRLDPDGEHALQDHRVDDFNALLSEIGLALGREDVPKATAGQRPDLVRHALAVHRALLVVDNLESFTPTERRRLYDLLEALPRTCRALVTSRRREDTSARTLRLDKLDAEAANQLLDSLGEKSSSIAQLTPEERRRLYAETGGNPLLLTWTAGQLGRTKGRCRTVQDAVSRLQEAHRLQTVNEKNGPLEFIFGDLLDTFTEDETAVLAALAHFTEPARVSWLLPLTRLSETAALTALDDLRDRALLVEDDTTGTWLLPPLAARFLRQRCPEAVGAAAQRLEEKAYALAVQYGDVHSAPFTELEAAWPTLQAALPLLIAGDNARLQDVCSALISFLKFSGRWDDLLSLNQEAEAKALASNDYYSAVWRTYHAGDIHFLRGETDPVFASADRCLAYLQQSGVGVRERSIAIQLRGLGHLLRKEYAPAIAAHQASLELARSLDPENADVVSFLGILAVAKRQSGDLDGAEADLREALRINHKVENPEAVAAYTGHLAEIFLEREDWPAAELQAVEALELDKGIGRQELLARDHRRLAEAMIHQERAREALPHAQQAVSIFNRLRSRELTEAKATLAACEAACSSFQPG